MPVQVSSNSAYFRRVESLKRWEDSETNKVLSVKPKNKKRRIKFSDGCVFLAACAAADMEEVEQLLEQGTDINAANAEGLTALHQACLDNNYNMVQFLVEHGCDVNRGDDEAWSPLHAVACCGFLNIAKYLIENGADVAVVNADGHLPSDLAESGEMKEFLSTIMDEEGIDCDQARSEEERIMLKDAIEMLNSTTFEDKIHLPTGATALHVAAAKGYIGVMNILIQAGADMNAKDKDGWTPLHAAAYWKQKEACVMLVENLANMAIKNLAGQTCFDVADPGLVKHLEELKKKQTSMQKEKPEARTSTMPAIKRTFVTRMSNQEKRKSAMKDAKSERARIHSLILAEKRGEKEREMEEIEVIEQLTKDDINKIKDKFYLKTALTKKLITAELKSTEDIASNEADLENIPLWKGLLCRSSENLERSNSVSEVVEATSRPKSKSSYVETIRRSFETQAPVKKRRFKRLPNGAVCSDTVDADDEKETERDEDSNPQEESGQGDRARHCEEPPNASEQHNETSSENQTSSRFNSISSKTTSVEDDRDYKTLYEELKKENEELKDALRKSEEELEQTKKQLQINSVKTSLCEMEKEERRSVQRKLCRMEQIVKQCEKLRADNKKLKDENNALIRVICKISK